MTFRILVFVGLRVYAVYLVVQAIALVPLYLQLMAQNSGGHGSPWMFLETAGMILTALVLWIVAGRIASRVVREFDPAMDKWTLTLEDAYTFAFVFLGLYFILSSLASALQQLYYVVAVVSQLSANDPQRSLAIFQLYKPGITLVAGFTSLLGAPIWARKLMSLVAKSRK